MMYLDMIVWLLMKFGTLEIWACFAALAILSFPFLSLSPNLFSLLPFLILLLYSYSHLFLFLLLYLILIFSFSLPNIFSYISSLIAISSSIHISFRFPLTALPVPRVQKLILASLTCPLLGALRAAIGIKYSFISFIAFILIGLSLNKSLIEPYRALLLASIRLALSVLLSSLIVFAIRLWLTLLYLSLLL